jgi:chromosomal replication initiation ATPase DnaA
MHADFDPGRDDDVAGLAAALVGFALGLNSAEILGSERGSPAEARARQFAIYLAYASAGMSLSRVAGAFGRDRSTIARACRLVEQMREDADFDTWIDQLGAGLRSMVCLNSVSAAV